MGPLINVLCSLLIIFNKHLKSKKMTKVPKESLLTNDWWNMSLIEVITTIIYIHIKKIIINKKWNIIFIPARKLKKTSLCFLYCHHIFFLLSYEIFQCPTRKRYTSIYQRLISPCLKKINNKKTTKNIFEEFSVCLLLLYLTLFISYIVAAAVGSWACQPR